MRDLRFKHARQLAGYTQQELAAAAGVQEYTIVAIETGRGGAPDRETAERIADLLGRRPWELGIKSREEI